MTTIILIKLDNFYICKIVDFSQKLDTNQKIVNEIVKRGLNPLEYKWINLRAIPDAEAH